MSPLWAARPVRRTPRAVGADEVEEQLGLHELHLQRRVCAVRPVRVPVPRPHGRQGVVVPVPHPQRRQVPPHQRVEALHVLVALALAVLRGHALHVALVDPVDDELRARQPRHRVRYALKRDGRELVAQGPSPHLQRYTRSHWGHVTLAEWGWLVEEGT